MSLLGPVTVDLPSPLYRVARRGAETRFAEIGPIDADSRGGNRFDVPGSGVLYLADDPEACFLETLARFRPSASARQALASEPSTFMALGSVPAQWREERVLAVIRVVAPLPFLDVDQPQTHTFLTERMGEALRARGLENLDKSHVRGSDRQLTRAIARWAFSATDDQGAPLYGGIRYTSRFDELSCYALFKGAEVVRASVEAIRADSPGLESAATKFGLTIR